MEVCYQTKFNNFLFSPSTHLCKKKSMSYSSSFQFLCANRRLYSTPLKVSIVRNSKTFGLRDSTQYCGRNDASSSWHYFNTKETIAGLSYDFKWHSQDNFSRNIVVRSQIAGTGSPAAAFPISELHLSLKIRGACFYAVTSAVAIVLFVLMLVAHPLVLLVDRYGRKFHHLIAKIWALSTVNPFFKVKFEGLENLPPRDSPAVYVSNHQSFLDIFALLTLGRCFKFISKTAIFLYPVVGWAMFLMGVIPLKRMDSRSHMQTLKRCTELVKKGGSVFFFPEGTRSKDGILGAFK